MNKRIEELAEQAGFSFNYGSDLHTTIERFAELVRNDEREACARLCDDWFAATAGVAIRERGVK